MSRQKNPSSIGITVALIDDDDAARLSIKQMMEIRGYDVEAFSSAEAALAWVKLPEVDCIISDIKMPGMDGEQFLEEVNRRNFRIPVIMITGHGDISMAVRCLKSGAYNFVEKPFEDEVLISSINRAAEKTALHRESLLLKRRLNMLPEGENGKFGMIGISKPMQDLYQQIEIAAKSTVPVLVFGETGSGKELVARAIHSESNRAGNRFYAVNVGALPGSMLESELFGHTKGAFTGADSKRNGKIISASGGTLLLDEIESISPKAQVGLLRVLDESLVYPIGQDTPIEVDIRLIATTKIDLKKEVAKGNFRADFLHRIMVLTIHVPSLRERTDDIPLLISHFLKQISERNGVPIPKIPEKTLAEMIRYSWDGNVRELKHVIERMVITSQNGIAGDFEIDSDIDNSRLVSLPSTPGKLKEELENTEYRVIEAALKENNGEITSTAAYLGISRRALYDRMKKYNLNKENYK